MAQRKRCRKCDVDRHAGEPHKDDCPNAKPSADYWEQRVADKPDEA